MQGRLGAGMRGALLLARGNPAGLGLVDGSPEGALASFHAAWLCLPAFMVLRVIGWSDSGAPGGGGATGIIVELLGFVIGWAGFALGSLTAADAVQRRNRWPLFIAAWNYTNVVQYAMLLLVGVVPALLGLPEAVVQTISLIALGYVLWLEWFVARTALGVPGLQAAGIVMIDVALSLFVAGLVAKLSEAGLAAGS